MMPSGVKRPLTAVLRPAYLSIAFRLTCCVSHPEAAPKTLIPGCHIQGCYTPEFGVFRPIKTLRFRSFGHAEYYFIGMSWNILTWRKLRGTTPGFPDPPPPASECSLEPVT
jgi:hypothetical protein